MSAKEIEMAYLAKQNAEYKKMYEEMRSKMLHEASEVKVYNRLITPEMNRLSRYINTYHIKWDYFHWPFLTTRYSGQFSNGTISSSKKSLKISRNSDGEMDGSSSDEQSSQTVKMSKSVTKTTTAKKVTKEAVQNSSSTASAAVKKN